MNKTPKVTIVIPVYNGEKYLREAIDSALNQTYKNIEVIVVNDGSKDKTRDIALSYNNKIKYLEKENGGVSTALNLAIEKMTGEYFSWLSHDDLYYPEKIEKQIEYLKVIKDKNVILYTNYELIDKNNKTLQKVEFDHKLIEEKPEYAIYRGYLNGITLLIPRQAFNDYGTFDVSLRCTQDYDKWSQFAKTYKFIHIPEVISKTRIHPLQVTIVSPNMIIEGNTLWKRLIDDYPLESKIKLENSEYNFYLSMIEFLKTTPYEETVDYAISKMKGIYLKTKKELKKVKVSVIIPFYNRIPLLMESINSVLNNTHKNIELLLINDGSTDDISILKSIISKNKNVIKLINLKENGGASTARNIGIEEASGEYIAFLDSDDLFTKEKIENQLLQMVLHNSNVSHTSYIRKTKDNEKKVNSGCLNGQAIPKIIGSCGIATPTIMIKTEYLKKNNFKFIESIHIGEDICFWLEILRNSDILGIEEYYTIVNTNEGSSAYNPEKQMIGLKNILTFVLNDQEFRNYNYEISLLCSTISSLCQQNIKYFKTEDDNKTNFQNYFYWFKKLGSSLKNSGVKDTYRKVKLKIKQRIKGV